MKLRLQEPQEEDKQAQKLRAEQLGKNNRQDINSMLHHENLPYVLEIILTKLISRHHDNLLARLFEIEKSENLLLKNTIG